MTKQDYRSHVGAHYVHLGVKHCSMQLLNGENVAVATADFVATSAGNGFRATLNLVRFDCTKTAQIAAEAWRDGLLSAPLGEMLA